MDLIIDLNNTNLLDKIDLKELNEEIIKCITIINTSSNYGLTCWSSVVCVKIMHFHNNLIIRLL